MKLKKNAQPAAPTGRSPAPLSSPLIRPLVQNLHPYVPGEQPKVKDLVKLNTNENPYPPSPQVLEAIKAAVDGRLRLYPNPTADALRERLAALHGCKPENLIVGNGSDELLALASRAFVEPVSVFLKTRLNRAGPPPLTRARPPRTTIQYFTPSYSLYPVLTDIHGAWRNSVLLNPDFTLPSVRELKLGKVWELEAALTYVTTPNAPCGRGYATQELEKLCAAQQGVVLLDEAYADFAEENALRLALQYPNVIVARTFSKSYSLCFQRVGYCVGPVELIAAMHRIRDSYNVNGLGQVGALATLDDLGYYRANLKRVLATRQRLTDALTQLEFEVLPSQTNFILVRPPGAPAKTWLERLRAKRVLVRWWDDPQVRDFLRISIGTDADIDALIAAVKSVSAKR
jgi:histidinol-phosphate aminotransferase